MRLSRNNDGTHGIVKVGSLWKHYSEHIFNAVKDKYCDEVHYDCCTDNMRIVIDVAELTDIINGPSNKKSPCLDCIKGEYIKLTDVQLLVIVSVIVSSIQIRGYITIHFTICVVLILKNTNTQSVF